MTRHIRSRLAGLRLPPHILAAMLGISQAKLNLILNEHRRPPAGFEAEATAALDRLERAEQAAAQGQSAGRCGVERSARGERCGRRPAGGLFIDDVAALLRCSPSTIKRRLRARVFPVAPLPGVDKRPRWSKARCSSGSRPAARAGRCGGAGGGRGERGRGTRRPGDEEAGCRGVVHGRVRGGGPGVHWPGCWPAVAAYWWEWPDATVRVVGQRPDWARYGSAIRSGCADAGNQGGAGGGWPKGIGTCRSLSRSPTAVRPGAARCSSKRNFANASPPARDPKYTAPVRRVVEWSGTSFRAPAATSSRREKGEQANPVAVRAHHHDGSRLDLRRMPAQDLDERGRRVGWQKAMRAEQNHAGRTAASESEDPAEVEIVGQQHEPVPPRPLEDLSVGSRAVADLVPMAGLDARVGHRLDPMRRQVHVRSLNSNRS